jgi:hypothetical protein
MNPEDYDVVPTPIEEVQMGSSLLVKHGGQAVMFQVENKKFNYTPENGTVWTLESEPVDGGQPWCIQGPPGTMTHSIVKKR